MLCHPKFGSTVWPSEVAPGTLASMQRVFLALYHGTKPTGIAIQDLESPCLYSSGKSRLPHELFRDWQ